MIRKQKINEIIKNKAFSNAEDFYRLASSLTTSNVQPEVKNFLDLYFKTPLVKISQEGVFIDEKHLKKIAEFFENEQVTRVILRGKEGNLGYLLETLKDTSLQPLEPKILKEEFNDILDLVFTAINFDQRLNLQILSDEMVRKLQSNLNRFYLGYNLFTQMMFEYMASLLKLLIFFGTAFKFLKAEAIVFYLRLACLQVYSDVAINIIEGFENSSAFSTDIQEELNEIFTDIRIFFDVPFFVLPELSDDFNLAELLDLSSNFDILASFKGAAKLFKESLGLYEKAKKELYSIAL